MTGARYSSEGLHLGALDFGFLHAGGTSAASIAESIAVARVVDELGFSRLWVGEHHVRGHACGSPTLLAGLLAAQTRRVRVGTGALLAQYYNPLKVAEDFRFLATCFGRIDLGLARSAVDDPLAHAALLGQDDSPHRAMTAQAYDERVRAIVRLARSEPSAHDLGGAPAVLPEISAPPDIWLCGSGQNYETAGRLGVGLSVSMFHGPPPKPEIVPGYRESFAGSADSPTPQACLAVYGICAETEEKARAIAREDAHRIYRVTVVGSPPQCAEQLHELQRRYDVDDILVLDIATQKQPRTECFRLLASTVFA